MMQATHKVTNRSIYAYRSVFSEQECWVVRGLDGVTDEEVSFATFEEAERHVREVCYDWLSGLR